MLPVFSLFPDQLSPLPASSGASGTDMLYAVPSGGVGQRVTVTQLHTNPTITGQLTITGGTVTASTPLVTGTQTWNNSGVTFTGWLLNVTNTASASDSKFLAIQSGGVDLFRFNPQTDGTNTTVPAFRIYNTSGALQLQIDAFGVDNRISGGFFCGGSQRPSMSATDGFRLGSGQPIKCASNSNLQWSSTTDGGGSADLILVRDAANTLAQRNSTNAQTFRLYNTYTDASNNEYLSIGFNGSNVQFQHKKTGTGSIRNIRFSNNDGYGWALIASATSGHWYALIDGSSDIGGVSDNRPRDVNASRDIIAGASNNNNGSFKTSNAAGHFYWSSGPRIGMSADGVIKLLNNAQTDFGRLQFGGTSTSFPAIKRNGTALEARLADDSAYTKFTASTHGTDGVTFANLPASPVAGDVAYVTDSTVNTWGATVAGGSTNKVLAWYNGSAWVVVGI